ncbi:MAG: hypothetical protein AAGF95_28970 [Chloroflexota bacterium]
MPHPDTSAANPLVLLDYATMGFELCERERQLARELAPLLERVAATCTEYAINTGEFDLVNRITSSADKTEADHDRWLHNVAISFLNADEGDITSRVVDAIHAYNPSSQADINALAEYYRAQGWTETEIEAFLILAKMEHLQYQQQLLAPYTDEVLDEMLAMADAMDQGGQAAMDAYREFDLILALPDQVLGEIASQLTLVDAHSLRLMVFQIRQRQAQLDLALGEQEIALAELTGQPPDVLAEAQARIDATRVELLGGPEIERQITALEQQQEELETYLYNFTEVGSRIELLPPSERAPGYVERYLEREAEREIELLDQRIALLDGYPDNEEDTSSGFLGLLSLFGEGGPNQVRLEEPEYRQWWIDQYKEQRHELVRYVEELAHIEQELTQLRAMESDSPGLNQQVDHAAEELATEQRQLQELTDSYQSELSEWETEYRQDISSVLDIEQDRLGTIRQNWEDREGFSPRVDQVLSDVEQAIHSANPNDLQHVLNTVRSDPELVQLELELDILYIVGAYGNPLADASSVVAGEAVGIDPRMNMVEQRESFVRTANPSHGDMLTQQALSTAIAFVPPLKYVDLLSSVAMFGHSSEMIQDPYISEEARENYKEAVGFGVADFLLGAPVSFTMESADNANTLREHYSPTPLTDADRIAQGLLMMNAGNNPENIPQRPEEAIADQDSSDSAVFTIDSQGSEQSADEPTQTLEDAGIDIEGLLETNDAGADAFQIINDIHSIFSRENDFGPDARNDNNLSES